jgi:hypothetical protein
MLNDLINSVKGQLTGELQNKFQMQPDTANKAVDLAKDDLENGLKNEATSGNFGGILDVLKGNKGATEQPQVNNMIGKYVNNLSTKLGVPESIAKQAGPFVISFIMQKLSGKVSSESDLMGMLGGGLKDKLPGGLGDKLGGMFK